jgi:preprotein translocase subunit SecY
MAGPSGASIVITTGWGFRMMTVITLTAGTAFIMWLGEQITERGIGNGISLIIFAGIVCRGPEGVINTFRLVATGEMGIIAVIFLAIFMVAVVGAIVFMETGQRRIPVQYAKRIVGRKMYGGQTTHLPLKINTSGVIPPIFASSIIMFPATLAQFIPHPWMKWVSDSLIPGHFLYELIYVGFIVFFCFFYTAVVFNPTDVAENMKKHGGFVPGIRPGKKTAEYIDHVLSRLTFSGAIYVSAVCVLPSILMVYFNVPFYFGGTALLIIVGVALDTAGQIETHLLARQYEGFLKKGRLAKRR